jgi:hypothetical protein
MLSSRIHTTIAAPVALAIAGVLSVLSLMAPGTALAANITEPQQEGQQFTGVVGKFSEECPLNAKKERICNVLEPSATITWGDGSEDSEGTLTEQPCVGKVSSCTFTVSGTHTYGEENPGYLGSVRWQDTCSEVKCTNKGAVNFTAMVRDAPLKISSFELSRSGNTASVSAGIADVGGGSSADFTATINWGDGSETHPTVQQSSGCCSVSEAHVYGREPSSAVILTVVDDGGEQAAEQRAALTLPTNTALPVISGSAQLGQPLSCSTGSWTGYPAPLFTYQWLRDGTGIGGATGSSYNVAAADQGHTLTCRVTASNSVGQRTATSAGVAIRASSAGGGSPGGGGINSAGGGSWVGRATGGVLGTGASYKCVAPRLKGLTLRGARKALRRGHCSLGRVKHRTSTSSRRNRVTNQSVAPGRKLAHGSKIGVTLGK